MRHLLRRALRSDFRALLRLDPGSETRIQVLSMYLFDASTWGELLKKMDEGAQISAEHAAAGGIEVRSTFESLTLLPLSFAAMARNS